MINDKMHKNGRAITDNASKALINNAGTFSEDIFKTDKILFVSSPNASEEKTLETPMMKSTRIMEI